MIFFAVSLLAIFSMVALAVDAGLAMRARTRLHIAADTAVIRGITMLHGGEEDVALVEDSVRNFAAANLEAMGYDSAKAVDLANSLDIRFENANTRIVVASTDTIFTPFVSVLGFQDTPVGVEAAASYIKDTPPEEPVITPPVEEPIVIVETRMSDVGLVLTLDLSPSMLYRFGRTCPNTCAPASDICPYSLPREQWPLDCVEGYGACPSTCSSGSGERRIDLMKRSVKDIISTMSANDMIAIVGFSGRAKLLMPSTKMTPANRAAALALIDSIEVGWRNDRQGGIIGPGCSIGEPYCICQPGAGCSYQLGYSTNIPEGLKVAGEELLNPALLEDPTRVNGVILLTDGEPNKKDVNGPPPPCGTDPIQVCNQNYNTCWGSGQPVEQCDLERSACYSLAPTKPTIFHEHSGWYADVIREKNAVLYTIGIGQSVVEYKPELLIALAADPISVAPSGKVMNLECSTRTNPAGKFLEAPNPADVLSALREVIETSREEIISTGPVEDPTTGTPIEGTESKAPRIVW